MTNTGKRGPRFSELLGSDKTDEGYVLSFLGEDGRQYSATLLEKAVGPTIDALQGLITKGQSGEFLTLTILSSQPVMTPEAKGLLVRTKEVGTIAVSIPEKGLSVLREHLAELEMAPRGGTA